MERKETPTEVEKQVVRRLQSEASAKAAEFSPELHARIMQAVAQQPGISPAASSREPEQTEWRQRARWAVSLAAMLLVFVSVFGLPGSRWNATPDDPGAPMPEAVAATVDGLSGAASLASAQIVEIVANQTLIDRHWEFWNDSKQSIGDTLLDPLPFSWHNSLAVSEDQGI